MICKGCLKEFEQKHGLQKFCNKNCSKEYYWRYWYSKNAESHNRNKRWYDLKRTYGITREEYNILFETQNGCCKICNKHQSELSKTLGVDHCHKTGRIRGLLCQKCNHAVGLLNDDPALFIKTAEYLN